MRRFFVGLAIIAMLGLVPCKARANDRQIIQQIVTALQEQKASGNLKGFNIDLQVDDGEVYLKGHVSTKEQEELALEIARDIDGVRQVHNEIKIVPAETKSKSSATVETNSSSESTGESMARSVKKALVPAMFASSRRKSDDSASASIASAPSSQSDSNGLAETIIGRLKEEQNKGRLKGFAMDLQVDGGVAFLTGKVATPEQQNLVLDIVRRVPGVKQVVNGLTIATQTKAPTDITNEVIGQLQAKKDSGELKDFQLDVETEEGIVWMKGSAASEDQRQKILDVARHVSGVSKVVNDISINTTVSAISPAPAAFNSSITQVANNDSIGSARIPQVLADTPIGSSVTSGAATTAEGQKRPTLKYMWVPAGSPQAAAYAQQASQAGGGQPLAFAPARQANYENGAQSGQPIPLNANMPGVGIAPARFDHPQMPQYAWPSYASYPNYGAVTYPKQYSAQAWPYIGPFYPYPQVPLGWRKVTLEWDDGWWHLDFKSRN